VSDLRDILEAVAQTLRKPVSRCELYDPNVCDYEVEHGWQPVAISGFPFTREVAFRRSKRKVILFANPEFLCMKVKGDRSGPVFSLGRPDRVLFQQEVTRYARGDRSWPVYASEEVVATEIDSALQSENLAAAVDRLLRNASDGLHLRPDEVVLYFQPPEPATVLKTIDLLLPMTGETNPRSLPADAHMVPKQLRGLLPLLKRWGAPDDAERGRILESASKRALQKLVSTVEPHFNEIDVYLRSFDSLPMPEAAIALGTLAECASEARLLLARETKNNS